MHDRQAVHGRQAAAGIGAGRQDGRQPAGTCGKNMQLAGACARVGLARQAGWLAGRQAGRLARASWGGVGASWAGASGSFQAARGIAFQAGVFAVPGH